MLVNNLLKDLAFPDPGRLLQRESPEITKASSESDLDILGAVGFIGILMILAVICGRFNTKFRSAPELPHHGDKPRDIPNSTLAERKHAILGIFETSQVIMVSTKMTR
jgi:hypothetical protein